MNSKKLEKKIQKYLNNEVSSQEMSSFIDLISKDSILRIFKNSIEVHNLLLKKYNVIDSDTAYLEFLSEIQKKKKIHQLRKRIVNYTKYAAVLMMFLGGAYFLNQYIKEDTIVFDENLLEINEESIVLEFENGKKIQLTNNANQQIKNTLGTLVTTQKGAVLNYQDNTTSKETLIYNRLSIPYGKKFQLLLSDGTLVHLNSGTTVRYPVQFIKGLNREIYVEEGEAYFKVEKDKKHPFIVHTKEQNIRVLGTEFNVSSYPEDVTVNTVLVEGSVSLYEINTVYEKEKAQVLKPGFKAAWDKKTALVVFDKVDTQIYTGWIEGKLIFKDIPFKTLRKKLERHYNVSIENRNEEFDQKKYTINFDTEDIYEVMNLFSKIYDMKFSIEENKIIIN